MDTQKIGRFLQTLRKEKNLTQAQLGEQLGVTDKTISRWETGVYLPPAEMLQALSQLHDVTINELLAAERITPECLAEKADETLLAVLKDFPFHFHDKQAYWRRKWRQDHRALRWLLPTVAGALGIAGVLCRRPLWTISGWLLLPIVLGYLNNREAAYVEHHLFDKE